MDGEAEITRAQVHLTMQWRPLPHVCLSVCLSMCLFIILTVYITNTSARHEFGYTTQRIHSGALGEREHTRTVQVALTTPGSCSSSCHPESP